MRYVWYGKRADSFYISNRIDSIQSDIIQGLISAERRDASKVSTKDEENTDEK